MLPKESEQGLRQGVTGEFPLIIDGALVPVYGGDKDGERVTYQQVAEVPGSSPGYENCYVQVKSECKEKC